MKDFMTQAPSRPEAAHTPTQLPKALGAAISWCNARSEQQIISERELALNKLEQLVILQSKENAEWLSGADSIIKQLSSGIAGFSLQTLAKETNFHDPEAVDLLRNGAQLVGTLPFSGTGASKAFDAVPPVERLHEQAPGRNQKLLASLSTDQQSQWLFDEVVADAKLGRMSYPVEIESLDTGFAGEWTVLLARRFVIQQGFRMDGSPKYRAVDDESANGLNPFVQPTEKLHCEGVDWLAEVARRLQKFPEGIPALWKADIDAAFRRIPISPRHRGLAWVTFKHKGKTYVARHHS